MRASILSYGAQPFTGTAFATAADCAPALNAALAAAEVVEIPAGQYRLDSQIVVPAGRTIVGEGRTVSSLYWSQGSGGLRVASQGCAVRDLAVRQWGWLAPWTASWQYELGYRIVPSAVVGHARYAFECVQAGVTGAAEPTWPDTRLDEGALIQDGSCVWRAYASTGVHCTAACEMSSLVLDGWSSTGVLVSAWSSDSPPTNANLMRVRDVSISNGRGHGIVLVGYDANAGELHMVDAVANRGVGCYDASFLGNTWVAPHTASNASGSYKSTGDANESRWIGYYSEADQAPAEWSGRTIAIPGLSGAGQTGGWTLKAGGALAAFSVTGKDGSEVLVGDAAPLAIKGPGQAHPIALQYRATGPHAGWYRLSWAYTDHAVGIAIAGAGNNWGVPEGRAWLPRGVHIGGGFVLLETCTATTLPRKGRLGDVRFNLRPDLDGVACWHCVRDGNGSSTTAGWRAVQLDGATVDGVA